MTEKNYYQQHLKGKSNEELLENESHKTDSNSKMRNALLMAFSNNLIKSITKEIDSLTKSIDVNSDTNQKLSTKLIYLNVMLTVISLIALIFIVLTFFNQ